MCRPKKDAPNAPVFTEEDDPDIEDIVRPDDEDPWAWDDRHYRLGKFGTTIYKELRDDRSMRYLAYVDLLGFGDRVLSHWHGAAEVYDRIITVALGFKAKREAMGRRARRRAPQIQFWSDAAVIVGDVFHEVAQTCQDIQTAALAAGRMLVRGVIAYGHHAELHRDGDMFVVSSPLVRAAKFEAKSVDTPRVVIDPTCQQLIDFVKTRRCNLITTDADDGFLMVKPFVVTTPEWLTNYENSLTSLLADHQHMPERVKKKYEWMLERVVEMQRAAAGVIQVTFCYQKTAQGQWRGTVRNYRGEDTDVTCFAKDRDRLRAQLFTRVHEEVGEHASVAYHETTLRRVWKYEPPKPPKR